MGGRSDFEGVIMALKVWSKQLLMIRPLEGPFLMASPRDMLAYAKGEVLLYTNTPQVLENTLSNQEG